VKEWWLLPRAGGREEVVPRPAVTLGPEPEMFTVDEGKMDRKPQRPLAS
jgi:hypothetical protein